jgi:imidazole glycerol-phosphate synthase subunit HisH
VRQIAVLDYGSGNLHSVSRALAHVGGEAKVTSDPADVVDAAAIVIPGVGHFGACMRGLREAGLDRSIKDFAATGRSVFGVCVGMQILFDGSEEDETPGLGVLAGMCRRLPVSVKVPHMGWNTVEWITSHPYVAGLEPGAFFYFVHSYAPHPDDDSIGVASHGCRFTAVAARANVFATQFHPEKSGDAGLHLYRRFVDAVRTQ